jgi:hypothetical protein
MLKNQHFLFSEKRSVAALQVAARSTGCFQQLERTTLDVEQDVSPKLASACVIVIDNAVFHKRVDIQSLIRNADYVT